MKVLIRIAIAVLVIAGIAYLCTWISRGRPQPNPPLAQHNPEGGYRLDELTDPGSSEPDRLFVILTFSGGGTRAAALSYGVLEELAATEIVVNGTSRRLLDEVDVISSISGGSFTAAYYGLFGDRIFEDFESRFLNVDVEKALTRKLFNPVNWWRLASRTFDRIDMAAEYYGEQVFEGATFSDLVARGQRPYVTINATDMTLGSRFTFNQEQFDLLCSDLEGVPIARAVASSSAFPGLLSPVTFHNYAGSCQYDEPVWVENALNDKMINPRRYGTALTYRSYQEAGARPFIHLLDGGLADNIGLRGPIWALSSVDSDWSVIRRINQRTNGEPTIDKLVIIAVNARTAPAKTWDARESAPGLKDVLGFVAGAPMDNYSFETMQAVKTLFDERADAVGNFNACNTLLQEGCGISLEFSPWMGETYFIQVDFGGVDSEIEAELGADSEYFLELPTTFTLDTEQVDRLRRVGALLLRQAARYQELVGGLQN